MVALKVKRPTNVTSMYAAAAQSDRLSKIQRRNCSRISETCAEHPRCRKMVEQCTLHAYERDNGPIVGAVDWQAILEWFLENGPAIMKMILAIIAMFG